MGDGLQQRLSDLQGEGPGQRPRPPQRHHVRRQGKRLRGGARNQQQHGVRDPGEQVRRQRRVGEHAGHPEPGRGALLLDLLDGSENTGALTPNLYSAGSTLVVRI